MVSVGAHQHVGYTVDELDDAMARFRAALGLTWAPVRTRARSIELAGRPADVSFRTAYSVDGPPHVELIEAIPDTIWTATPGVHHVGHWVDDVGAASARLEVAGWELAARVASDRSPGRWRWAYHHNPAGGYVELLDAAEQAVSQNTEPAG